MPNVHALVGADRVRQNTTTTGTGALSLGTVPSGARGFVAAGFGGKTVRALLRAANGTDWQIFDGVVTDGDPDTLSRVTTYGNHLGTTADISLAAGTHTVEMAWDATSAALAIPRLLTNGSGITLAGGTLTVDCMGSADVIARVTLSAAVTSIVLQNVPERCGIYFEFRQSGGPHAMLQAAWPVGTVFESPYNLYTDSTVSRFRWVTSNGGTEAFCECNGPLQSVGDITLSSELNGNGQIIGRYLGRVVTGVSGALTAAAHSGCILVTGGNVVVPKVTGFHAVVIAGGVHHIEFDSFDSPDLATGDIVKLWVQNATTIHAERTLVANKVAFSAPAPTFLYEQDFEGTGAPSGWSTSGTVGAVDYDYATSPAPLSGTKSLSIYIPSSGYRSASYASFTEQADVYVSFIVRNQILIVDGTAFFAIRDSINAIVARIVVSSGSLLIRDSTASGVNAGSFALNTTYTFMMRYQKGTGSNSIITLWILSGGEWSQIGQKTNGTATTDASRLFFEMNRGAEARLIVDKIRVSTTAIPGSTYT